MSKKFFKISSILAVISISSLFSVKAMDDIETDIPSTASVMAMDNPNRNFDSAEIEQALDDSLKHKAELFRVEQKAIEELITPHFPRDGWLTIIKQLYLGFPFEKTTNWSCGCGCEETRTTIQSKNWKNVRVAHNKANPYLDNMRKIYKEASEDMFKYILLTKVHHPRWNHPH